MTTPSASSTSSLRLDAEQAVLSAMFMEARAIETARAMLRPEDFADERNALIFAAMLRVAERGETVDPLTVASELERERQLERAGGKTYIGFLIDAAPTAANVGYHAALVLQHAQRRMLVETFERGARLAREEQLPPDELAERFIRALATLQSARAPNRDSLGFRLMSTADVLQLPPIKWMVEGLLPAQTILAMFGPPAAWKSFLALDLACSIATGTPWLGHPVRRGAVVYIAAEGVAGLPQRLAAWLHAHAVEVGDLTNLHFVTAPVHIIETVDASILLAAVRQLTPSPDLIIFDTVARTLGDRDDVKDMGALIESADRLRRATGAGILFVHHPNADGNRERGGSRLRGDVETLLQLKVNEDGRHELVCEKQKDGADFPPIGLELVPTQNSCVIQRAPGSLDDETGLAASLTDRELDCLRALSEIAPARGSLYSEWEIAAESRGVSRASYYRARKRLVESGYVSEREIKGALRCSLTDSGRYAIQSQRLNGVSPPVSPTVSQSHRFSPLYRGETVRRDPENETSDQLGMASGELALDDVGNSAS